MSVVVKKSYRGPDGDDIKRGAVKATVTGSHDGKFCFRIDRGQIDLDGLVREPEKIHYRGWTPIRRIVGFLDEPDVPEEEAWEGGFSSDDEAVF